VNAITNIGTDAGIPVYNLDGNLVVSTTGLLFNGLSTAYSNPIDVNQNGTIRNTAVWTGTWDNGVKDPNLSDSALGDSLPFDGASTSTIFLAYDGSSNVSSTVYSLYGISGVLTVPTPTSAPEPASMGLLALGSLALVALRRR
jgi:hypothetical protein